MGVKGILPPRELVQTVIDGHYQPKRTMFDAGAILSYLTTVDIELDRLEAMLDAAGIDSETGEFIGKPRYYVTGYRRAE